ncbi:MAG: hypothetical protein R2701_02515 [Acidimicrobiales bacterium]
MRGVDVAAGRGAHVTGFVLRRAGALVLTVLLALAGLFALLELAPGEPSDNFGAVVVADPEARAAIEASRGLDRPAPQRFWSFLTGAVRGDLGTSYYDGSDVAASIAAAAPVSLEIGFLATVLVVLPGIALGALAARRRGRPAELVVSVAPCWRSRCPPTGSRWCASWWWASGGPTSSRGRQLRAVLRGSRRQPEAAAAALDRRRARSVRPRGPGRAGVARAGAR